jgi:Fic family protein
MPAGRFVNLPAPYADIRAFVPDDLPPALQYSAELTAQLSRASAALGSVSGLESMAGFAPSPMLFAAPFLRMEALASSRIEGTQTTAESVFRAEATSDECVDPDTQEVVNYLKAIELGVQALGAGQALDLGLLCSLHRQLLDGARGRDRSPGSFRQVTAWIGGRRVERASYVPPDWREVESLMRRWERYVRACIAQDPAVEAPALVQCALIHPQLEMIHPFRDGNGRIGRLLMSLFLIARGSLQSPVLFLSAYFERHRREYYDRLLAISQDGDWSGWVTFFLEGVEEQSVRALDAARTLLALREEWRSRLAAERTADPLLRLLDRLFENPCTTIARVTQQLAVSYPTASKYVSQLQQLDLLQETTGRRRNMEFCARALLRHIEKAAESAD